MNGTSNMEQEEALWAARNNRALRRAGLTGLAVAIGALVVLLLMIIFGSGCSGPLALYTPATNYTALTIEPVRTNTIVRTETNWVMEVVTQTNVATGDIIVQPMARGIVSNYNITVIEMETNQHFTVSYSLTTNAATLANTAGSITNMFAPGFGGLVAKGISGALLIVGGLMGHKYKQQGAQIVRERASAQDVLTKTAGTLTQGIEVYREVAKTTPQGAAADEALVSWLRSHQQAAGVAAIVAQAVDSQVNNFAAKQLAQQVLEEVAVVGANPVAGTKVGI